MLFFMEIILPSGHKPCAVISKATSYGFMSLVTVLFHKKVDKETDSAYVIRIEDWKSDNHQIITWFRNTSISSIVDEFDNIDIIKGLWDLLVTRYAGPSGARNFKLTRKLYHIC